MPELYVAMTTLTKGLVMRAQPGESTGNTPLGNPEASGATCLPAVRRGDCAGNFAAALLCDHRHVLQRHGQSGGEPPVDFVQVMAKDSQYEPHQREDDHRGRGAVEQSAG